jgi:signal transduction histidine kinase
VSGNVRQLESLWVNLLLLARDAISIETSDGAGAIIRIRSRLDTPDTVVVEVIDNGISIANDQLGTIFEPNFVGPTSGRGDGMELSICREIVRQHGGQIAAESYPERDTILRVSLPAEG